MSSTGVVRALAGHSSELKSRIRFSKTRGKGFSRNKSSDEQSFNTPACFLEQE